MNKPALREPQDERMDHPPLEHVLEDLSESLTVDQLWAKVEGIKAQVRELTIERGHLEQILWRRAKEARPEVQEAGSAVLAGETTELTVGASRTWEFYEKPLQELGEAKDGQGQPLLTAAEYSELVTWIPKVDGVYFNTLLRRGGFVAEALKRCRSLKSASPTFTAKARR